MNRYIREFRENGDGFQDFTDEAIIYALLEYSKFQRPYTPEERIKYMFEKCCDYDRKDCNYSCVSVEIDDVYGSFTVLVRQK